MDCIASGKEEGILSEDMLIGDLIVPKFSNERVL
jgi:hypothetical protein